MGILKVSFIVLVGRRDSVLTGRFIFMMFCENLTESIVSALCTTVNVLSYSNVTVIAVAVLLYKYVRLSVSIPSEN